MRLDRGRQNVVRIARQRLARGRIELVNRAGGNREHLHADAGRVHVGKSSVARVEQLGVKRLNKGTRGKHALTIG